MRIDSLAANQNVLLQFAGYTERALFKGVSGSGDERVAKFTSVDSDTHKIYEWEAYRYCGRWAYGTSAQPLRAIEIL